MEKKFDALGLITVILQSLLNLLHYPWFAWLLSEQIKTGWGYGTDIEMAFLFPFFLQIFFFFPTAIVALGLIVFRIIKRNSIPFLIANASLFAAFALQVALFYLFVWY